MKPTRLMGRLGRPPATPARSLGLPGLAMAVGLMLAACGGPGATTMAPSASGADGRVELRGAIRVQGAGGFSQAPAFRLLQAAPQASDVKLVRVYLKRVDQPSAEVLVGALPGTLTPIVLRQLRQNAQYEVRLEADDADDARIDHNATDGSSPELGFSTTRITTTNLPLMENEAFRLRLVDVPFQGDAAGDLDLSTGSLVGPVEAEAVATNAVGWPVLAEGYLASDLPQTALIRYEGLLHPVLLGGYGPDTYIYTQINAPPSLPAQAYQFCAPLGQGQGPVAVDGSTIHVDSLYFGTSVPRAGYGGALFEGHLVSLPIYNASALFSTCAPQ